MNPNLSRRSRWLSQTNHKNQNYITPQPPLATTCLSLRYNAACCIRLRNLRHLRENNHIRVLNLLHKETSICLSQITLIIADKTQNSNNCYNYPTCLSLRYNAACCIPYLRNLRNLRENIHVRVLNLSAQMKPQYLPQIPLIHADKPQNSNNWYIRPICLSLRDNAACCIPLRDLRYLRENNTQEYSIYCTKKPQCVSRRFTQTKTVWVNESCGELIINWNSRSHIYVLQVWASKRPFNNM